jgi:putative oxidoreductase
MTVAGQTVRRQNGFFLVDEGYEYVAALAAAAVTLGPGRVSVGRALGVERFGGPAARAAIAIAGAAVAALQLTLFWRRPSGSSD